MVVVITYAEVAAVGEAEEAVLVVERDVAKIGDVAVLGDGVDRGAEHSLGSLGVEDADASEDDVDWRTSAVLKDYSR
jgi:hypothetical protein